MKEHTVSPIGDIAVLKVLKEEGKKEKKNKCLEKEERKKNQKKKKMFHCSKYSPTVVNVSFSFVSKARMGKKGSF